MGVPFRLLNVGSLGPLRLRVAQIEELAALDELYRSCARWYESEGRSHWRVYLEGSLAQEDISRRRVYSIFNSHSLLASFTLAEESPPYSKGRYESHWANPDAPSRFLRKLAVSPQYHRCGLGTALTSEAERIAAEQGAEFLRLDVNRQVLWLADFYEALGYSRLGELEDGLIFEKRLSECG